MMNGDGIPGTAAQLNMPGDVAVDPDGNLLIADSGNFRIRKLDGNGMISTIAGDGTAGSGGDGGPPSAAQLNGPAGLAVDKKGNLCHFFYCNYLSLLKGSISMEQIFKVSSGFKIFFWVLAVLCFLLVFIFPAGILLIYIIFKAEVRMTPETLEVKWIGRKVVPWNEITEFSWQSTRGFFQGMMRPLRFVAKNPSKTIKGGIPVGAFERSQALLAELQKRSGKTISK